MKNWPVLLIAAIILLSMSGSVSQVDRIASAIAYAEGFYVSGSRAQRNNNPGNLTKDFGFPVTAWDGMFAVFATVNDGWEALKAQVRMMLDGTSAFYGPDMTIFEVAVTYTTTDQEAWASNVAARLGVTTDTPIGSV
jgi:hypothetical protein